MLICVAVRYGAAVGSKSSKLDSRLVQYFEDFSASDLKGL